MKLSKYLVLGLVLIGAYAVLKGGDQTAPKPFDVINRDPQKDWFSNYQATPIDIALEAHPFMASLGSNSMHGDAFNSDVHTHPTVFNAASPIDVRTRVGTKGLGGQCATKTIRRDGKLQILCSSLFGFEIQLIDPDTLNMLARHTLPPRPSLYEALLNWDRSRIMLDSSGAYFYTDQNDDVFIADSMHHILQLRAVQDAEGLYQYVVANQWDLSSHVDSDCLRPSNPFPQGKCDPITGLLPDYNGLIWWVSRYGRVGTLNTATGAITAIALQEEIQNGFAIAAEGVYIVSDTALYLFNGDGQTNPKVLWREAYDRGTTHKVGSINQGSGTTPSIFGDYITITDNADDNINLVIYGRYPNQRKVCEVPLFESGASATENSMIAFNNSVIIENNAGFTNAHQHKDYSRIAPGLMRIDVSPSGDHCEVVWHKNIVIPSVVSKLSSTTGLVYTYTFETQADGSNDWYLVGLDYQSGDEAFRIHTGNGKAYNNNFSPITLAADGTVYIGSTRGLISVSQP